MSGSNVGAEAAFRIAFALLGVCLLLFSFLMWPIVIAAHNAQQSSRRAAMARNASELGLRLQEHQSKSIAAGFSYLNRLRSPMGAFDKYALNIIQGDYLENDITAFDYHYAVRGGVWWWAPSWTTHHYSSFVMLHMQCNFPELTIQKEGFRVFEKIAEAFGGGDIDFESKEFSDRFTVRSKDKKFAYDFCNAKMIDYLLDQPIVAMEIEEDTLAIGLGSQSNSRVIVSHLRHLSNVRALIPDYLFANEYSRSRKGNRSMNSTDDADPNTTDSKRSRRQTRRVSIYEPTMDEE